MMMVSSTAEKQGLWQETTLSHSLAEDIGVGSASPVHVVVVVLVVTLKLASPGEQSHAHLFCDCSAALVELEDAELLVVLVVQADLAGAEHDWERLAKDAVHVLDELAHTSTVPGNLAPDEAVGCADLLVRLVALLVEELRMGSVIVDTTLGLYAPRRPRTATR